MSTAELERRGRAVQSAQNVRDFYDRKVRALSIELDEAQSFLAAAEERLREARRAHEEARCPVDSDRLVT